MIEDVSKYHKEDECGHMWLSERDRGIEGQWSRDVKAGNAGS